MKILIILVTGLTIAALTGCVKRVHYATDYERDYVYSVSTGPVNAKDWDNTTYPGYQWGSYPWYGNPTGI